MPDNNHLQTPTSKRPFATTADRYNDEQASGNVKGSNFPYHEVRSLPGYSERDRPCLTAAGVTNELACCLAEYAKQKGSLLPYQQRDMSHYLRQAPGAGLREDTSREGLPGRRQVGQRGRQNLRCEPGYYQGRQGLDLHEADRRSQC